MKVKKSKKEIIDISSIELEYYKKLEYLIKELKLEELSKEFSIDLKNNMMASKKVNIFISLLANLSSFFISIFSEELMNENNTKRFLYALKKVIVLKIEMIEKGDIY